MAGTKYRGEFEERLEAVVREATSDPSPRWKILKRRGAKVAEGRGAILMKCKEYGARNLERTIAMERLIGNLIAEALLSGKITGDQTIQLEAVEGRIQLFQQSLQNSQAEYSVRWPEPR